MAAVSERVMAHLRERFAMMKDKQVIDSLVESMLSGVITCLDICNDERKKQNLPALSLEEYLDLE